MCYPLQELLRELEALGEAELAAWAAAHRERLSLSFLGWLSDEELASAADQPQRQQALWELGSRLMALREGLSPVANEVLQAELRAAALSCSGTDSSTGGSGTDEAAPSEEDAADAQRRQQWLQEAAAQQAQRAQHGAPAALATASFASSVQRTAALGLSPEGMVLFEQQAAALEAVVGTSRAKSLTEVIGRARVQDARQVQRLAESDAAVSACAAVEVGGGIGCGACSSCSGALGCHARLLPMPGTLVACEFHLHSSIPSLHLAPNLRPAGAHPGCAAQRARQAGACRHAARCLHATRQHRR